MLKKANALTIRFLRRGVRFKPNWIIVLTLKEGSPKRFFRKLGFLNIHEKEGICFFDSKLFSFWLLKGASVNKRVKRILGILSLAYNHYNSDVYRSSDHIK